jgi:DNA-binding transcriptional MerR regulator
MKKRTTYRFTLPELAATAASALATTNVDQASGRVSDVPSSRTIRYYASHGLLDAPDDWEGRTAIYGRRHLLQLVAIKRLQAKGYALADVQKRLHGLRDDELEGLANLPPAAVGDTTEAEQQTSQAVRGKKRSREAFWGARGTRGQAPQVVAADSSEDVGAMRLDDDVLLVLEGLTRTLDADDRHALKVAAEPLLHLLKARNLIGAGTKKGGRDD